MALCGWFQGVILDIITQWTFVLFLAAADCELYSSLCQKKQALMMAVAMILRIWAMYDRSRLILGTLLTMFCLEIIFIGLAIVIYSNPRNVSSMYTLVESSALISYPPPVIITQILDFSFCTPQPISLIWTNIATILGIVHGGVMCILTIVQFVRQSLQMYRVTRRWQLSQYMSLLVKQGILYFLAYVPVSLSSSLSFELANPRS